MSRRLAAVVIGASAGGIEALSMLLPRFVPGCGLAVFVVVHVPRDRRSLLSEIFVPKCRLRVVEAEDKQPVEADTIYFAPPDYHLMLDREPGGCRTALSADELVNYSRPSIDVLFETAAEAYGESLLGIILSGANHDGSAGLGAVIAQGGMAYVQSAATAQSTMMVMSAASANPSATVLPLSDIAELCGKLNSKGAG